jgi:hypothetical protein
LEEVEAAHKEEGLRILHARIIQEAMGMEDAKRAEESNRLLHS